MSGQRAVIMLPGLGMSRELFVQQRRAFQGRFIVPPWLEPGTTESLANYARRMADVAAHELREGERCVVGGCSMGGFIAAGMRPFLPCDACLMISSVADPKQLPTRIRMWKPLTGLVGGLPVAGSIFAAKRLHKHSGWFSTRAFQNAMYDFGHASPRVVRWGLRMVPRWSEPMPGSDVPTYHLHGSSDHVIPAKRIEVTTMVPGGGHLLPLSHPGVVTDFIKRYAR